MIEIIFSQVGNDDTEFTSYEAVINNRVFAVQFRTESKPPDDILKDIIKSKLYDSIKVVL